MTWAAMKCNPEETARRQEVCNRMNTLYNRRNHTDDKAKQKRIDRELSRIRANESFWLKEAAYFLY